MKQVLIIGALLLTIGIKLEASMPAHGGAVGEANAAKPRTTPTAASACVGSGKQAEELNTNKGAKLDGHKGDDGNQWDAEYTQE